MFFVLSKLLKVVIYPSFWIILLITIGSLNLFKKKWNKRARIAGLVLLLFFSNDFISNAVFRLWEEPVKTIAELPIYQYGIILTGCTKGWDLPDDRIYLSEAADRVVNPIYLYKAGKIKKILISGGNSEVIKTKKVPEAVRIQKALIVMGIPSKDILIEPHARNTYENAQFSFEFLKKIHGTNIPKVLVITSSFHMIRSRLCFNKTALNFDTFPVDYRTHAIGEKWYFSLLIPNISSLMRWNALINEWIGIVMYKVSGHI